ncbi:structure-specific endonuclease subunit slx1 [Ischnura elegans]|uniref:structure-specific endonuclease subunit slx1 n=1 Tax=Ischnura elegans TaxID=197161 RepID=UPI001ED8A052|nr:structure-specific endonuclease subunit slx1 [Ischnura elegans]
MAEVVENFYGVYLLFCENPKYTGRTYIGFTVNPNRRIIQHNKGVKSGGAWRTSNKGPWVMVLVVHGFPNEISALRFEWAWQNPQKSRRLNSLPKKAAKEKKYDYCLRILSEMLLVGPWNRLPLTVRWLSAKHMKEFPPNRHPPLHMPITYGHVVSKKVNVVDSEKIDPDVSEILTCRLCNLSVNEEDKLTCLDNGCPLIAHIVCLAKRFLGQGGTSSVNEVIPVSGECPECSEQLLWGDLIRKKNGCYADLVPADESDLDKSE